MRKVLWIFFFWVHASLAFATTAEPVDETRFREVAGKLRCPTCTGLSVLDSEAQFSVQIKDEVKKQMEAGKSEQDILAFFTERYGPWILREPPKEGVNSLAWWLPISILVLGPFLVWYFIWRRETRVATHGMRSTEEILREMRAELQRYKKGESC